MNSGQQAGGPGAAVIAGLLGFATAALLAVSAIKILVELPSGLSSQYVVTQIVVLVAAAFCLLGTAFVVGRKVAGAFVLVIGAIATAAAILVQPPLQVSAMHDTDPRATVPTYGEFLGQVFKFENLQSACVAIALILAPILLIFSVIPPTLNWLRAAPAAQSYGGYQG